MVKSGKEILQQRRRTAGSSLYWVLPKIQKRPGSHCADHPDLPHAVLMGVPQIRTSELAASFEGLTLLVFEWTRKRAPEVSRLKERQTAKVGGPDVSS